MALFANKMDSNFVAHINRELIRDIIDTEVAYYKVILENNKVNIYGEVENGTIFYEPVIVPCLIERTEQSYSEEDHGQDYNQTITFSFLREMLVDLSLVPEVGDIVEYNNEYWEIDDLINNQFWAGKNPDTAYTGTEFGMNVSITLNAHLTRKSRIAGIVPIDYNVGLNK